MADGEKFKVVIAGGLADTRVFAPDGTDISEHVRAVEIVHKAGDLPVMKLDVIKFNAEIEVAAENPFAHMVTELEDVTSLADKTRVHQVAAK